MRSKLVTAQLGAFLLVAVLGLVYVGANYVRLPNLLGFGRYTVYADFSDSGGIFQNAEVTYRGVPVGRVGELSLIDDGVRVALLLDSGGPDIPAQTRASVVNRSAIGEQFVDIMPTTDSGPYLENDSVIPMEVDGEPNTSIPVPVQDLFSDVQNLAMSVPADDLRTLITELGTALDGKDNDLVRLVESLDSLSADGVRYLPQTMSLINNGQPVLATQAEQSGAIGQFSADLVLITEQLRTNDPDLRRLIDNGTPAAQEVGALIDRAGPGLTTNLGNIAALIETLGPRSIALRPLLTLLPALGLAAATSVTPGDGTIHQGIIFETNNPPPCTIGYEGTAAIIAQQRAADPSFDPTQQDYPINTDADCRVPFGSATGVRSGSRIIYADPAIPQPWDSTPKRDPDKLDLRPIAAQLAFLMGVTTR